VDAYPRLIRPLLFRLEPERAHELARPLLANAMLCRRLAGGPVADPRLATHLASIEMSNPVGLAPGFDKDARMGAGLAQLGFGLLTLGTVMPRPRSGNPRPRIVRRPTEGAMVNAMGLPGHGLEPFARHLARLRAPVPVVASIGAADDDGYERCFRRLAPLAAGIEINLRCNNNRDDRGDYLMPDNFERLIRRLLPFRRGPVFVKVNDWQTEAEHRDRLEVVARGLALGIDGFCTLSVLRADEPGLSVGRGNLTGRPLLPRTLEAIRDIRDVTRGRAAIRARGGITTGADAFAALAAGASTVELFTAFIYRGWTVAPDVNAELLDVMTSKGVRDVAELIGAQSTAAAA
jgi:dihydroorotate dehydrogenase